MQVTRGPGGSQRKLSMAAGGSLPTHGFRGIGTDIFATWCEADAEARKRNGPHLTVVGDGDELRAHLAYRRPVILAEIGNHLVIRNQPTGEPHHLNVAARLTLKPAARLNPIEINRKWRASTAPTDGTKAGPQNRSSARSSPRQRQQSYRENHIDPRVLTQPGSEAEIQLGHLQLSRDCFNGESVVLSARP
jgi:hypothetical protein